MWRLSLLWKPVVKPFKWKRSNCKQARNSVSKRHCPSHEVWRHKTRPAELNGANVNARLMGTWSGKKPLTQVQNWVLRLYCLEGIPDLPPFISAEGKTEDDNVEVRRWACRSSLILSQKTPCWSWRIMGMLDFECGGENYLGFSVFAVCTLNYGATTPCFGLSIMINPHADDRLFCSLCSYLVNWRIIFKRHWPASQVWKRTCLKCRLNKDSNNDLYFEFRQLSAKWTNLVRDEILNEYLICNKFVAAYVRAFPFSEDRHMGRDTRGNDSSASSLRKWISTHVCRPDRSDRRTWRAW